LRIRRQRYDSTTDDAALAAHGALAAGMIGVLAIAPAAAWLAIRRD
jgi:hypothetical protein